MNISSRIGSYLSSPIGIKSNTYDDSNFETSIFKKTLLTNTAIIVGASLIGLKARSLPKDIFIQAKKEPIVKNNFSQLIERSKTFFEKLNPKEIDKILTSLIGKSNVSDLYFYEKAVKNPEGRVKEYIVDKYKYVLEARMAKNKPVVRFFSRQPNKNKRFYLTNRGEFQINAYSRFFTHLKGDKNTIAWIKKK